MSNSANKRSKDAGANAAELREILRAYRLTQAAGAELAMVSKKTVEAWLASPDATSYRAMPDRALELVKLSASRLRKPKSKRG